MVWWVLFGWLLDLPCGGLLGDLCRVSVALRSDFVVVVVVWVTRVSVVVICIWFVFCWCLGIVLLCA